MNWQAVESKVGFNGAAIAEIGHKRPCLNELARRRGQHFFPIASGILPPGMNLPTSCASWKSCKFQEVIE